MIAHGHVNAKYIYCDMDFYPGDANHKIWSYAKLLRGLERPPILSSCALFMRCERTPLYEAVFEGNEIYLSLLQETSEPLPPTPYVQLDNYAKDNKYRHVFCF